MQGLRNFQPRSVLKVREDLKIKYNAAVDFLFNLYTGAKHLPIR